MLLYSLHKCLTTTLILTFMALFTHAQDNLRAGMSADEFRKVKPGILPEEASYSGTIGLVDIIEGIAGTWNFSVGKNALVSAQFNWKEVGMDEDAYNLWKDQVGAVCNLAQKAWGAPLEFKEGKIEFHPWDDPRPQGMAHGSREVFQDLTWEVGTNRIAIYSGFSSNHYPLEMTGNLGNNPPERFSYGFSIIYEKVPRTAPLDRVELSTPSPEEEHSAPKQSEFSPANVHLGMSLKELKAAFPRIKASESAMTGQFSEEGECKGLSGGWHYEFEKGTLKRWSCSHYGHEVNEAAFKQCLAAADAMVADCTKRLGKPDKLERDNTKFIDPAKKHHWGYKVLRATWSKPEGTDTEVRFEFFGGKGDYFFVVEMTQEAH